MTRNLIYGSQVLRKDDIRLLEVLPAHSKQRFASGQPLFECRLHKVSLTKPLDYVALSYTWGDPNVTKPISLNGYSFEVTISVYEILQVLSSPTPVGSELGRFRNKLLWIDAVCINQKNEEEKAHQVQRMGDLYSSAPSTLIWLGHPPSGELRGLGAFDWLKSICSSHIDQFLQTPGYIRARQWNQQGWSAVGEMLEQPWFSRRWIIQEVARSQDPWVLYGINIMRWDSLRDGIERCGAIFGDVRGAGPFVSQPTAEITFFDIEPVIFISILRHQLARKQPMNLLEIMSRFRRSGSSNPRDRIYAHLGLCSGNEAAMNAANYKISAEAAFMRYAVSHVQIFKDLNFLSCCTEASRLIRKPRLYFMNGIEVRPEPQRGARMTFFQHLPTWAPNWTSPHAEWLLGADSLQYGDTLKPLFRASSDRAATVENLGVAEITRSLRVRGLEVDRVWGRLSSIMPVASNNLTRESNIFEQLWNFACRVPLAKSPYQTEEDRFTAYLRTITAGGRGRGATYFVTDEYLRHLCLSFFDGTPFGNSLRAAGFRGRLPTNPRDRYMKLPASVPASDDQALIFFDKLCFFTFVITMSGRVGLAPPHTQPGDSICVLFGASSPLLLHPASNSINSNRFYVRGESYLHGFMFGEAVDMYDRGQLKAKSFCLI